MDQSSKDQPTPLSKIGEFELIKHLTEKVEIKHKSTLKGIGDDAAIIEGGEEEIVVTTDMLCEGIHFDLLYTPIKHLGYKAVVVNLSDIYAMNARPEQITVSIAVSNKISVEFLEDFYEGIQLACDNYQVDLVGGDTTSSNSGLVISVTAIGRAKKEDIVYRDTASANELICVSGDLGGAYMGLQLLEREKNIYESSKGVQPDLSGYDYILERQLKPEARFDIIHTLKEKGILPTSMIDVSDGLSSDLLHLCVGSNLGCSLYEEKIPIDTTTVSISEDFKIGQTTAALNGGEDYELLFTAKLEDHEKLAQIPEITIIGHMNGEGEGKNLITTTGSVMELTASGWDGLEE